MPLSVPELFARGAQRTIEFMLTQSESQTTIAQAKTALERRFGVGEITTRATLDIYTAAGRALLVGHQFELGLPVSVENLPINPSLSQNYAYTTVGQLPDPFRPGQIVDIPYIVYSPVPLSPQEIRDQAEPVFINFATQPERGTTNENRDIQRRDARFLTARTELQDPVELLEILIVSAYRRQ